jgi:hypothetical protein
MDQGGPISHQNYYNKLTEAKWTVVPRTSVVLDEIAGRADEPLNTLDDITSLGPCWIVITETRGVLSCMQCVCFGDGDSSNIWVRMHGIRKHAEVTGEL